MSEVFDSRNVHLEPMISKKSLAQSVVYGDSKSILGIGRHGSVITMGTHIETKRQVALKIIEKDKNNAKTMEMRAMIRMYQLA